MNDTLSMSGTKQSDSVRRRRTRATDIGTLPVAQVGENDAKVLAKCGDLKWDADRRAYLHA